MEGPRVLENAGPPETLAPSRVATAATGRAVIDTSAPFESVKEAVEIFGGSAQWKSQLKQLFEPEKHHYAEEVDVTIVEEQAAKLEKDLVVKERETLDVLKELEMTKRIVDDLKSKLRNEASEVSKMPELYLDSMKVHPILETEECSSKIIVDEADIIVPSIGAKQSPGLILVELEQAKLNLNRTTSDLACIRASIGLLNNKIEKERVMLENTREKLTLKTALASSLDEELNQTTMKLQKTKNLVSRSQEDPSIIAEEIEQLSSKVEEFRKMKEASKSDIMKLAAEIEQTKTSIKTAEIRWLAAKKMEEAARAVEAVAVAEIKTFINADNNSYSELETPSAITLSIEEYTELKRKAQAADEASRKKIEAAMIEMEEANQSKQELLMKMEKAAAEVKTSREALEDALIRVEAAKQGKLAVEEALRRWRSEQKRRHVHNSPKFKNSHPGLHRRESRVLDLNGLSLDVHRTGMKPTISIGQILSRKLMAEECAMVTPQKIGGKQKAEECTMGGPRKIGGKPKVSLGQMLSTKQGFLSPQRPAEEKLSTKQGSLTPQKPTAVKSACKQYSAKRKRFGLTGFSLLKAKQSKKTRKNEKKKEAWSPK